MATETNKKYEHIHPKSMHMNEVHETEIHAHILPTITMCIRNASKIYLVMTAADLTYGIRA